MTAAQTTARGASPTYRGRDIVAPNACKLLLECRAPWEFAAMWVARPWLKRLPKGDGHPVIVLPGLGANDLSTAPLRSVLKALGYCALPWNQGINRGPRPGVQESCKQLLHDTAQRHGCKVSLVGWSLGGVFAREMAKESPALSRCVVTLGTPFTGHPRATNAWRLYEVLSGQRLGDATDLDHIRALPTVPTTSIYSKTDGIVAWQCSINDESERAENVEVRASHFGMAMNPLALYAIADRLQQPADQWQRFDARGARRWFFRTAARAPLQAAAAA